MRYYIFLTLIFVFSCSDEPTDPVIKTDPPSIVDSRIPENWNLADSSKQYTLEVTVSYNGDFDQLNPVVLKIKNTSGTLDTDSLYDDGGVSGSTDVIKGDGVFRNQFSARDFLVGIGNYDFIIISSDKSGNSDSLIIPVVFNLNYIPLVNGAIVADTLRSGSEASVIYVFASDRNTPFSDLNVFMDVLKNGVSELNEPYILSNNGDTDVSGDLLAGDSVYSFKLDSSFAAGRGGDYTLQFKAIDNFDEESELLSHSIFIENIKSEIINIDMPESVNRPANIPIKVLVHDPQGPGDIQRVYLELKASDGFYIESSPGIHLRLDLYDDGDNQAHGDALKGDSVFSLILSVDETNIADIYTFEFYAIDKIGHKSTMASTELDIQ